VKSPEYYQLLFKAEPCLIVLDDLDEIDDDSVSENANTVMKAAYELVADTPTQVVVGSRPEAVLKKSYYERDLQWKADVGLFEIDPLGAAEEQYFISRRAASEKQQIEELLKARPSISEMATQLDYLNTIMKHRGDLAKLPGELDMLDYLVQQRTNRNVETHWARMRINAAERMKEIASIALHMSLDDTNVSDDNRLSLSGFTTVRNGKYAFSPSILQSYFALKAFQWHLTGPKPMLSNTLLADFSHFVPLPPEASNALTSAVVGGESVRMFRWPI